MLFAPEDVPALAHALEQLVGDPALRDQLAGAGQSMVRSNYTAQIRADRFASLYRELAA